MTKASPPLLSPRDGVNVVGHYALLRTLGQGSFATVKLAKHMHTGKEVRPLSRSSAHRGSCAGGYVPDAVHSSPAICGHHRSRSKSSTRRVSGQRS